LPASSDCAVLQLQFHVGRWVAFPVPAQSNQQGKILRWDIEAYGKHGNVTRNAAVYYIQIGTTVYQVTRGTTKSEAHLAIGKQVQCRMEKDHMFIPDEKGKEVKYLIIGASEAQ
jgi:hypothetical protein